MKIVKAELDDELHAAFKVWSYQTGVTMAQALVSLIESGISKRPPPLSKGIGAYELSKEHHATGVPVEYVEGGPIMGSCSKCGDKVPVSKLMMHPKFPNKKFCPDCVENMKNNQ